MLSSDDYYDFSDSVQEILDSCFLGVNIDDIPEEAALRHRGYTKLTKDKGYYFTDKALQCKEQLIGICQTLPIYPAVSSNSCGTIAYAALLPDDMTSKMELEDACELADEFFVLLELNDIGVVSETFKNKYGIQLLLVDPRLKDKIKPNRSAFVQEDIEPNI